MRKIVVYELLSLDGVAEAPETFFGWDDALDAKLAAAITTQDAVILGRRNYDEWARFWPRSEIEPFASFINAVTKYVATSTPLDRDWANATAIDGDLVEFVRASQAAARRRYRRPRKHLRRAGTACRRRRRRAQAHDRADDRRPRTDDSSTAYHRFSSNRFRARPRLAAI
jgi:hypothetical protein